MLKGTANLNKKAGSSNTVNGSNKQPKVTNWAVLLGTPTKQRKLLMKIAWNYLHFLLRTVPPLKELRQFQVCIPSFCGSCSFPEINWSRKHTEFQLFSGRNSRSSNFSKFTLNSNSPMKWYDSRFDFCQTNVQNFGRSQHKHSGTVALEWICLGVVNIFTFWINSLSLKLVVSFIK